MEDLKQWQLLKAGDHQAFENIYRSCFQMLYAYGKRICRNEMLVEDCIQNLFVELWKNKANLGETDSIIRYLSVSLRRKIIRELKSIRSKEVDREIVESDFENELSFESRLELEELDRERAQKFKEAFDTLSPRQREVIYLKYTSGMSYEDIGEIMNINYQSARNLVSRAIKQMQSYVKLLIAILFTLL